jgi:tRNA(fMet)-specific endonuclease VapC
MVAGGNAVALTYLLDTNILVAYVRAGDLGAYVEEKYALRKKTYRPLICEVTIGEMLSLAQKLGWGKKKVLSMEGLLKELVRIDISSQDVMEAYASIDDHCRRNGWCLGKNDVWIAAATKAAKALLLTTDKDFLPLFKDGTIRGNWIDERDCKSVAD